MFKFSIEADSAAEALAFMAGLGVRADSNLTLLGKSEASKVPKMIKKKKPGKRQRARAREKRERDEKFVVGKPLAVKPLESKGGEKTKGKGNQPSSHSSQPEGSRPRKPETATGHSKPEGKSKGRHARTRLPAVKGGSTGPKATSHQSGGGKGRTGLEGAVGGKLATADPDPRSRNSASPIMGKAGSRRSSLDLPDQGLAKKARLGEPYLKTPERMEKRRLKDKPMEVESAANL